MSHLTDEQIVLVADGELPSAEAHLDSCSACRARLAEVQGTMAEFAHVYRAALDSQLPPPRDFPLYSQALPRIPLAAAFLTACLAVFAVYVWRAGDLSTPKNSLTPGETRAVTIEDVCRAPREDPAVTIPVSLKQQVFQEYGIHDTRPNAYEVDYLITPELGGANSIRNLWPEPYSAVWNAHVKDRLEDRLHGLVCTGQVDLATAQRELSQDWIAAYKKYFHTDKPF